MSAPVITVLMSVYNGGQYLKGAIESVLNQTFVDFEFLIIDDASGDQSVKIIESYKDARIRLIKNEKNLGQTSSLNKGLSLAKGRYIARIDADDLAFSFWLEKSLALLQKQPLTAVVGCKAVVIDGENKVQKTLRTPCCYEQMVLRSLTATPINHVGAVYKTDVISSVGGYQQEFKIAADFELWSNLIRRGIRLAAIDEVLVAVRVHEMSLSILERGRADILEISRIMARNFESLVNFSVAREDIELLWKLHYATSELTAQEFQYGMVLLHKAYSNINSKFVIADKTTQAFDRHQQKIFYTKRALGQIQQRQLPQLRMLALEYFKRQGCLNVFSLFWIGSWLGKPFLRGLPVIYKNWRGWSAKRKIQRQIYPQLCLK